MIELFLYTQQFHSILLFLHFISVKTKLLPKVCPSKKMKIVLKVDKLEVLKIEEDVQFIDVVDYKNEVVEEEGEEEGQDVVVKQEDVKKKEGLCI